jgi:FixJ family two-component response regulator
MNSIAKIMVIDDEVNVVKALTRLLNSAGYEASGTQSSRDFLDNHLMDDIDCILMDLDMPDIDGIELQGKLSCEYKSWPIIFVSGHADIQKSVTAMKGGAVDFLTKPVDADDLFAALNAALTEVDKKRLEREELAALRSRFEGLTPREKQVFEGVVAGLLNKQIAVQLGTAEKTVKVQRAQVMQKMSAHSFADLVRMATRLFD